MDGGEGLTIRCLGDFEIQITQVRNESSQKGLVYVQLQIHEKEWALVVRARRGFPCSIYTSPESISGISVSRSHRLRFTVEGSDLPESKLLKLVHPIQ
jgi:hypothetical protein